MTYRLREENRRIRDMFSRISERYDLLNRLLSMGQDVRWRRKAATAVEPREGGLHLDLACGTGDVGLEIARQVAGARLVCADLSPEMLVVARRKVAQREMEKYFSFVVCAGETLPFREGTFDTVSIAFGIRNIVERKRALEEISRVLKPRGKLIILEFSLPTNQFLKTVYLFYFTKLLPWLGGILSEKGAYAYLPNSVMKFPPPEQFVEMMRASGFRSVCTTPLSKGIVHLYVGEKGIF